MRQKAINTLALLTLLLATTACDTKDDLEEIFLNKKWTLAFFQEGTQATSAQGSYILHFYEGSFSATTPDGAQISGNWQANNSDRSFSCSNVRVTNGNIDDDSTAKKIVTFFTKATSYGGDANYLQIKQQSNVYMQYYSK